METERQQQREREETTQRRRFTKLSQVLPNSIFFFYLPNIYLSCCCLEKKIKSEELYVIDVWTFQRTHMPTVNTNCARKETQ